MSEFKYFDRAAAALFLTAQGFPTKPATLAKLASIGGGPEMRKFGRRVLYEPRALIEWGDSKLSLSCRSTSDRADKK